MAAANMRSVLLLRRALMLVPEATLGAPGFSVRFVTSSVGLIALRAPSAGTTRIAVKTKTPWPVKK